MSRWVSSANRAAAQLGHIGGFFAVDLDFVSGHVRANDSGCDFSWGGNSYTGIGTFGGFDSIDESVEVVARGVKLTLSGVDSGIIATIMNDIYQGRPATIYVGLVDPLNLQLVDTPEEVWSGYMDTMDIIIDGDKSRIELQCEHRLRFAPPYARFSDADQKARSPGDRFFDLTHLVPSYVSSWGGKSTTYSYKPGSGYNPQ